MVISFFLFAATEVNLKLLFNRVCVCVCESVYSGGHAQEWRRDL